MAEKNDVVATSQPDVETGSLNLKAPSAPNNDDVGLNFLSQNEKIECSEEEFRTVRWKTDLYLLPILCLTFGLQYLDKVTVSYAAVYGMRQDLNLVGQQYSWANSIFYFGYLVAQGPSAYLLAKVGHVGRYAAVNIVLWGITVICCAAAKNFAGLAALRFLMGVFEASIGPCWVSLMGMFYRNEEQGARATAWYSFVGVAAIVGGLMSYGIGHINGAISEWQIVFLIMGAFTILWGVLVWFTLPSDPTTAYFFTPRERIVAIERLRSNRTGLKSKTWKWKHALEALTDPQCWMIALWAGISNITNIAGSFLPLIIQDMGFSGITTTLLTLPVGGVEIVAMLMAGVASSYFKNGRTVIMFIVAAPTVAGIAMIDDLPLTATWARVAGVWLVLCVPASYAILLSLISSNVAGYSKKLVCTSMTFIFFCVGNIVSPQLFISTEAPRYRTGTRGMLVAISLVQALTICLGAYYFLVNRSRDRKAKALSAEERVDVENEEFFDRTDKEDWVKFRYCW